jgi:hypothetical protein
VHIARYINQFIDTKHHIPAPLSETLPTSLKNSQAPVPAYDINNKGLNFLQHIPLKQSKIDPFMEVPNQYRINLAMAQDCGDEKRIFWQ